MLTRRTVVTAVLLLGSAALVPGEAAGSVATAARAGSGGHAAAPAGSVTSQLNSDFAAAWQITRGKGVTVAVLSTGAEPGGVPSLAGAVTVGPDFTRLSAPVEVEGTLAASFIAGSGPTISSPAGTLGLAPDAHILSVRVEPDNGESGQQAFFNSDRWESALIAGIRYAAGHGADVIYTDECGYEASHDLDSAVSYALSKDAVVVAPMCALGSGAGATAYPAGIAGVVGVGSVGTDGRRQGKYAMASPAMLVSGLGTSQSATGPGDQPYYWYGITVATAWVAAAAALVRAEYPKAPPALVALALAKSARHQPPGGYDTSVGFGVVNPAGALAAAGRLIKLATVAPAGQAAVAPTGHFGGGPPADKIEAVKHSTVELAGLGAAALAGIACLALAVTLSIRWRRRAKAARPQPADFGA